MQASTKIHQPTNIESCMQQLTLHTRGYNSSGLKPTNTCSKCQENSYHYTLTCNVFVRSRESFGGHNHRWPKTSCFQVQPVCSIHVAMMLWVYSYQVEEYYIDSFKWFVRASLVQSRHQLPTTGLDGPWLEYWEDVPGCASNGLPGCHFMRST